MKLTICLDTLRLGLVLHADILPRHHPYVGHLKSMCCPSIWCPARSRGTSVVALGGVNAGWNPGGSRIGEKSSLLSDDSAASSSEVTLGKRCGPKTLRFFTLEKHATKSHLSKLKFRAGRSDIGGPERVSAPSNAEMKLHGVSSTGRVLTFVYVFVHAVGGAAPLHSPRKTLRQRQPKTGSDA